MAARRLALRSAQFLWTVLEIRQRLPGASRSGSARSTSDAEFYTYSAVFIVIGLVLLAYGILRGSRQARLVSAVFILLAVREGVPVRHGRGWTARTGLCLSSGLGMVLVGIGLVYQKLVFAALRRAGRHRGSAASCPSGRTRWRRAAHPERDAAGRSGRLSPALISGREHPLGRHIGQPMRIGDGLAGHLAVGTLRPSRRYASSASALRQPLSASASVKGSVTLFSAKVEVRATAPGMLATQ